MNFWRVTAAISAQQHLQPRVTQLLSSRLYEGVAIIMSLDRLPEELLVEVIRYLVADRGALRALGQCTLNLWQVATPILYSQFGLFENFEHSGYFHLLFLRTILERPTLAKYVRSLSPCPPFRDLHFILKDINNTDNLSRDDEVLQELDGLVKSIGHDRQDVFSVWLRYAKMFRCGASTLLFLLLLPNLEHLQLEFFEYRDLWLITLCLCPKAYEILDLISPRHDLRIARTKPPNEAVRLTQEILGTPDIKDDDYSFLESWSQVPSRVKSLTLQDMDTIPDEDFYYSYLLSAFPCLTRLQFLRGSSEMVDSWRPSASDIVASLSHLRNSLEELTMQVHFDDPFSREDEYTYPWCWSTLAFLKKLVYLEVPTGFLFGFDKTTHCKLPMTLQILRIHECNKTTLAGLEDLLQSTHHLKTITLYFDQVPAYNYQSPEKVRKIWHNDLEARIADHEMLRRIENLCINSHTKLQVERGCDILPEQE